MPTAQEPGYGSPLLYRRIEIPKPFLTTVELKGQKLTYGGDLRMGDLTGDGIADFLVYRCVGAGLKPCFLGAFSMDGKVLWQEGEGGEQPARPGAVAIHDIDGDGKSEVVCFFKDDGKNAEEKSLDDIVVQIREGSTGRVKKHAAPAQLCSLSGEGPNWCHQRIMIADLRGTDTPRDFVVKLGDKVLAFDENLDLLWTYTIKTNERPWHTAYIPVVGDIDSDGRDEVFGGHYLLGSDGQPRWEKTLGPHMDSVAIAPWHDGHVRVFGSGAGHILDADGKEVLKLGEEEVPHGQELRVADFVEDEPAPQMIIRTQGHNPDAILVTGAGEITKRFRLNTSPNDTGMEVVYWNGEAGSAVLFNGGQLWHGDGRLSAELPGLPDPVGPGKMGWYHCIPANVCGDHREEVVTYNPWDRYVWIFTPSPLDTEAYRGYRPGPRQYNARLMD